MTSDAVDAFVHEARAFCRFVEMAATLTIEDRLATARVRLLALYTAALSLPHVEGEDVEEPPHGDGPSIWIDFGDRETYWEVSDPYVDEAHVAGSLADDIFDVYRDVRRGLRLWDASQTQNAIFEWRFGLDAHWGDHAIDALRALHRACKWRP